MAAIQEVAQWMADTFNNSNWMHQNRTALGIAHKFGREFTYKNKNGNLAIDKKVLEEFRKLTGGKAVWDRGQKAWRHPRPGEVTAPKA